jgi:hypothetical protein
MSLGGMSRGGGIRPAAVGLYCVAPARPAADPLRRRVGRPRPSDPPRLTPARARPSVGLVPAHPPADAARPDRRRLPAGRLAVAPAREACEAGRARAAWIAAERLNRRRAASLRRHTGTPRSGRAAPRHGVAPCASHGALTWCWAVRQYRYALVVATDVSTTSPRPEPAPRLARQKYCRLCQPPR